jgi:hypothetical protein
MRQQPSEMLWCLPSGACFGPTPSTTIYGVAMLIINYESPITNYYSPLGVLGVLGGSSFSPLPASRSPLPEAEACANNRPRCCGVYRRAHASALRLPPRFMASQC